MKQREFLVKKDDVGTRLDIFLALHNNDISRSFIKKNIESNNVIINDEIEYRANYKVRELDHILLSFKLQTNKKLLAQDIPLNIIFEDENLVVINKDSGISVHPRNLSESGTIVNALLFRYKKMESVGPPIRAGLIHRIDKGTSGILLVGKTNLGLWHYSKQFANRMVGKVYIAVYKGSLNGKRYSKSGITVENYLGRNPRNRMKFSILDSSKGKFSKSTIFYINSVKDNHLFLIKPFTGRTHQIRIHMASLGLQILGDDKYGGSRYERLMLHAWKLSIPGINLGKQIYIASPPIEFKKLFKKIDVSLDGFKN